MLFQKLNDVSICIPARNEAKSIESIATFCLSLLGDHCEVIVGANGCTDSTEQIVETLAKSDSRLRLVRSDPGKSYAVNALVKAARNNILLFLDADVRFEREAPIALVNFLRGTDYVAACPDLQVIVESPYAIVRKARRLWHMPLRVSTEMGLTGAMYALKKVEFLKALKDRGYPEIPPVINEDHFIHLVLEDRERGKKRWSNVPQAVVSYKRSGVFDSYKRAKRIIKGDLQLLNEHPSLGLRNDEHAEISPTGKHETSDERRQRRIQTFKGLTLGDKLLMIMMLPIKRSVFLLLWKLAIYNAKDEFRKKRNMVGWTPTQSDR